MATHQRKPSKSPEELNVMFQQNHVLSHSNKHNINTLLKNEQDSTNEATSNDSTFDSDFDSNISMIGVDQIENDPKTPLRRAQFRQQQALTGGKNEFSPASNLQSLNSSSIGNSPSFQQSSKGQPSLLKKLYKNPTKDNLPFIDPTKSSTPNTNGISTSSSSSSSLELASSPSKPLHQQFPKQPASILKKKQPNLNIESTKSVNLEQELLNELDEQKETREINPTKLASKVLISPKKNDIIHSYAYSASNSPSAKNIKHASPLSDTLNGNTKSNFKSPYLRSSGSNSTKRKTSLNKEQDNEWLDDKDLEEEQNEEVDNTKEKKKRSRKSKKKTWISLLTSFKFKSLIDPELPYILSLYLQLIFNVLIVSILLYFIYSFISTVKADVENKVDSYASDIIQEIALCSREYLRNNCQPGQRVVALEAACSQWEKCMNQDPTTVGRAKIGAETFAEIINGFIKPISWKSMIFLFLITVGSLVLTNAAFGTYRNYTQYENPYPNYQNQNQNQNQQQQQQSVNQQSYQTPFQTPYRQLQYDGSSTRFYTPKPMSPSLMLTRQRSRNSRKSSRR
ncbi:Nucleus export protein BRL1 [Wickerhamomyces ciferrii]|uniref:Nucleus export protein BRL1 n=1 Tax=Wickerhamomyces ciferrii (strain ATCC 14091 / BCRC 22168 / CBS 111 / JCM 3599 / NBRC 0793 / NRRL Y-1031 F-60-10) TaxID=1206466 RepID=K0KSL7_WICCF|nr:Nucleus export protein BRL1 [Wickerhamomyces ciferrii]CCH44339.1 Nucleus export protein BRL1 [Wickerhamomyces ciferrii]